MQAASLQEHCKKTSTLKESQSELKFGIESENKALHSLDNGQVQQHPQSLPGNLSDMQALQQHKDNEMT